MKEVKYETKSSLEHPKAADYVPTFLYEGLPDPSGKPDVDIRDDFFGTRRKLRIGVLGAGIMGLQFLHSAESLRDVEMIVYEMNDDVGGVVMLASVECEVESTDRFAVADKQVPWMSV